VYNPIRRLTNSTVEFAIGIRGAGDKLRHRDVVSVALRRLKRELQTDEGDDVLRDVIATVREHGPDKVVVPVKLAEHNHHR
jgi:hypothetical protein